MEDCVCVCLCEIHWRETKTIEKKLAFETTLVRLRCCCSPFLSYPLQMSVRFINNNNNYNYFVSFFAVKYILYLIIVWHALAHIAWVVCVCLSSILCRACSWFSVSSNIHPQTHYSIIDRRIANSTTFHCLSHSIRAICTLNDLPLPLFHFTYKLHLIHQYFHLDQWCTPSLSLYLSPSEKRVWFRKCRAAYDLGVRATHDCSTNKRKSSSECIRYHVLFLSTRPPLRFSSGWNGAH